MPTHARLTPDLINALRPERQEIHTSPAYPALCVVVSPTGTRYFAVAYRDHDGRTQRPKFAPIPPDLTWTQLEAAATNAARLRSHADAHGDPKMLMKEEAALARKARPMTLDEVWTEYTRSGRFQKLRPGTKKVYTMTYVNHLSSLGGKLMIELTLTDLVALYDQITKNRSTNPGMARSVIITFDNLWAFADRRGMVPPGSPRPTRYMNDEVPGWRDTRSENRKDVPDAYLRRFWELTYSLDRGGEHHPIGCAVRLIILTGLRHGNIKKLMWDEVDLTTATLSIPAAKMKGKRDFTAPLTPLAMSELFATRYYSWDKDYDAPGTWVFGRITAEGHRAIWDQFIGKKRRRPNLYSDLPGPDLNRHISKWGKEAGVPHRVTAHALRKTFARWVEREVDYSTAGRLLHHQPPKDVTSVYLMEDFDLLRARADRVAAALKEFLGESYKTKSPRSGFYHMWRELQVPEDEY